MRIWKIYFLLRNVTGAWQEWIRPISTGFTWMAMDSMRSRTITVSRVWCYLVHFVVSILGSRTCHFIVPFPLIFSLLWPVQEGPFWIASQWIGRKAREVFLSILHLIGAHGTYANFFYIPDSYHLQLHWHAAGTSCSLDGKRRMYKDMVGGACSGQRSWVKKKRES